MFGMEENLPKEKPWTEMTNTELALFNINFSTLETIDRNDINKTIKDIMIKGYKDDVVLIKNGDENTIEFYAHLEKERREGLEKIQEQKKV